MLENWLYTEREIAGKIAIFERVRIEKYYKFKELVLMKHS